MPTCPFPSRLGSRSLCGLIPPPLPHPTPEASSLFCLCLCMSAALFLRDLSPFSQASRALGLYSWKEGQG